MAQKTKAVTSRVNLKVILQVALALIAVAITIYFIKHNEYEIGRSITIIRQANLFWIAAGILIAFVYLLLTGLMYRSSFGSLGAKVTLASSLLLALKRNFISVFLPAGGVSSLAFFTSLIEKQGVSKTRIHLASTIYGIAGFASLALVAIPAIILLLFTHQATSGIFISFALLLIILLILVLAFRSILRRGFVFRILSRFFPGVVVIINELEEQKFSVKSFLLTLLWSLLIEFCGILHLFIALKAIGADASLETALTGYVIATLFLAVSPFMRGLGAVELSLTYLLIQSGVQQTAAISATLIYRVLEFWLPLAVGAFSFFYKKDSLAMRVFPSFVTLLLGLVNVFSVLTPAIAGRLILLRDYLPENAIDMSNIAIIVAGIALIILSAYLIRGLRNAWIIALILSGVSVLGHLTKAIDYEEAMFSLCTGLILIYTRRNYIIRSDRRLLMNSFIYLAVSFVFIITFGSAGFYMTDPVHYGHDIRWFESIWYSLNSSFFFNNNLLEIHSEFGWWFVHSLNLMGALFWLSLLVILVKPGKYRRSERKEDFNMAGELVQQFGNSALDYFKTYKDKTIYIARGNSGFVSFKKSGDYAVVLEMPVCSKDNLKEIISEFDEYCALNGLKTLYYRVDEEYLPLFGDLKKKSLFIGQEGLLDIQNFTLEGGEMKSTRNAIHKLETLGYVCKIVEPPVKEGLLQKMKAVSNEWLASGGKKETSFSQGIWDAQEIKNQKVLIIEDPEEKVVAFLNIIPDYAQDEVTYDLIRKTVEAPKGVLDTLLVRMTEYYKNENKKFVNLGLAPFSGLEKSSSLPESTLRFAYRNLKFMEHYKGLRFFKEKYATVWKNKYLVYNNDLDLLQAPRVISKVSKVKN